MTSGIVPGNRLCFNYHAPEQAAVVLALHQPAANQLSGNNLRLTAEKGDEQKREILGDARSGYGYGLKTWLTLVRPPCPGVSKTRQQGSRI